MAEWLRHWTRNPMGSPCAGSNPAHCVFLLALIVYGNTTVYIIILLKLIITNVNLQK